MERRLAAILAADVVGYSRLIGADEEGTLAALKTLRADLIDPKIAEHHGRIVKLMGDGMLAEFPSVVDAVRAAVTTQSAIAEHNADLPEDKRLEFRVGINLGDVVIDGDDIQGDGVNVAARLEGLAVPGGICVSGSVHEQVRDRLDLPFEDLGEKEVKNIARPVRVWQWLPTVSEAEVPTTADTPLALPDKPSIAVLPFDNMSEDPEQEYFADGITEDIITALSKFRWFFVIARNSTFTYKGAAAEIRQVGKELGVRFVLEGSVRKSGSRVRISAQLIEAESGNHIWAERYDRSLEDIFDIQDDITEKIVGTVTPEVSSFEQKRAARRRPENLDAWGLLQQGLNFMWRWDRENFEKSVDMFRRAVTADPSLSQAHSYMAFALLHMRYLGHTDDDTDVVREAARHTREALSLDDMDSLAHAMLARIFSHEGRHEDSIKEARRAVQLNPNHSFAHQSLALMYVWANRCSEGLEAIDQAIRLSPNDPFMPIMLASKCLVLGESGRMVEALEVAKDACRLPHEDYRPWLFLAAYAAESDDMVIARDAAAKVLELRPEFTAAMFRKAWAQMHPAVHDSLAQKYLKAGLSE